MSVVEKRAGKSRAAHYVPRKVKLGNVTITRFIIGGNPFGGFSHQTLKRDDEMMDWYTTDRVKQAYKLAEKAGVTTHLGRVDEFIIRALREYWNDGGRIKWIAQTCPGVGTLMQGVENAIRGKAKCCFLHGGEMDHRVLTRQTRGIADAVAAIKDAGMAVGVAGHRIETIRWAADKLDLDFFMTCYYNPSDRTHQPHRNLAEHERYLHRDREAMCAFIQQLPAPAIHYKVLAAGRHDPRDAFEYVAEVYRPGDAVCVGIFTKDNMNMIREDVDLLESALRKRGK
ncbi:MAG: hypothetical protein NTZ09_06245 [Candidatus Hydrogenedentes bacterium]|nr:hypothetical protein [Candidatus Hydrogenedentota bacterium]